MTSKMPLAEFVQYQTEDKVLLHLHALLWPPKEKAKPLLLCVPGMTGGFASPHDLNPFVQVITMSKTEIKCFLKYI